MQALFSEHWHAVRDIRPQLREGILVLHRTLRGKRWVLLMDPATQRFHRISVPAWTVIEQFDGHRSLEDFWQQSLRMTDDGQPAPTVVSQQDLVDILASLHSNDLLQTQVTADADEMFARYEKQRKAKRKQRWMNPLSIRVPLFHPDRWFARQIGLGRVIFSKVSLLLWLIWVVPAGVLAWQHWTSLSENLSDRVLAASNLVLLWFTYPVVKVVHEWAHGLAVKAWGGTVGEVGLMFIVFTPVPYVDASSSHRFPSRWARAAVSAAGIMAELAVGALAVYVWLAAQPGLITALAFNAIFIAGVSTLLVNGNPLMRFDGYFIACDVLDIPNLAQRSTQYWTYLLDRHAFGAMEAQPPLGVDGERRWLWLYGAIAPIYRLMITIGLIWFVASEYLFAGAIMAIWALWTTLVTPLWKAWKHLRDGQSLARRRSVALRRSILSLMALAVLLALIPVPFYSVQQAVVWLPDEAIIRAEASGHVRTVYQADGQSVSPQEKLLELDNPALSAELSSAAARVSSTEARLRKAEVDEPTRTQALREELAAQRAHLAEVGRRVEALHVSPRVGGKWSPASETKFEGRYVKRGEIVGYVLTGPAVRVRTAVTQEDMGLIRSRLRAVDVRLEHSSHATTSARLLREVPGGEFNLVSAALGTNAGGNIPVDPSKPAGTESLERVFDLELELAQASPAAVFGDRAYVRFDLGAIPVGYQWFLRIRQAFLSRLNV